MNLKLEDLKAGDELVYDGDKFMCLTKGKTYQVFSKEGDTYVKCNGYSGDSNHLLVEADMVNWKRFIQKRGGWIGVDLDATLAVYDGWKGPYHIGTPIAPMVVRVKKWIEEGRDVRIFTARMTGSATNNDGTPHDVTKVHECIEAYCLEHVGKVLPITNIKDWNMMELWDDRAIQVRPNTGISLAEELEAIKNAEAEPKYPQ